MIFLLWALVGTLAGVVFASITMRLNEMRFFTYLSIGVVSAVLSGSLLAHWFAFDFYTVHFTPIAAVFGCSALTLAAYRAFLFRPHQLIAYGTARPPRMH